MTDFIRQYRVLERIGRGAMGDTYAGYDEREGRNVALRFVDSGELPTEQAMQSFVRAVRAAATVTHPSVCAIHDVLEQEQVVVIVLERVAGQTVHKATERGPLGARDVCRLGRELSEGLAAAHARGIVHSNISAANVMIDHGGHAKLMDLGLSRAFEPNADARSGRGDVHSRTVLLGTPVYMAPEVLAGGLPTSKSDLYAVGVVLYRMATGMLPFAERMTPESLEEMLNHPPVPPSLLVAGLPPSLERAILGLLEKQPGSRFPSAESLAATLAIGDRV